MVEYVRLGDYITQIRGVSYTPKDIGDEFDKNCIPILRANNIQDDGLNFDDMVYVNKNRINCEQLIRKNDILICTSSGSKNLVGKAAFSDSDENISFGAFCKIIRPSLEINPQYVGHYFKSPQYRKLISNLSAGANINNIRNEHISNLVIPLPPLHVQQQIAHVLDVASDLITKRKKQIALLDDLAKSLFVEMFGDPVENPFGWGMKRLEEITSKITDGKHGDCESEDNSGYYFISAKDIVNGSINYDKARQITKVDFEETNLRTRLQSGDVIVANSGTIGKSAIVTDEDVNRHVVFQKSVAVITPNTLELTSNYLNYYIVFQKDNISNEASGTAQKNWLLSQIRNHTIPLPPLSLQQTFASRISQIEAERHRLEVGLHKMEENYKALMQEYFG